MSDLQKYIKQRSQRDPEFAEGLEVGYAEFKIGVLLRQALAPRKPCRGYTLVYLTGLCTGSGSKTSDSVCDSVNRSL